MRTNPKSANAILMSPRDPMYKLTLRAMDATHDVGAPRGTLVLMIWTIEKWFDMTDEDFTPVPLHEMKNGPSYAVSRAINIEDLSLDFHTPW